MEGISRHDIGIQFGEFVIIKQQIKVFYRADPFMISAGRAYKTVCNMLFRRNNMFAGRAFIPQPFGSLLLFSGRSSNSLFNSMKPTI
jgi:hypothetical protein